MTNRKAFRIKPQISTPPAPPVPTPPTHVLCGLCQKKILNSSTPLETEERSYTTVCGFRICLRCEHEFKRQPAPVLRYPHDKAHDRYLDDILKGRKENPFLCNRVTLPSKPNEPLDNADPRILIAAARSEFETYLLDKTNTDLYGMLIGGEKRNLYPGKREGIIARLMQRVRRHLPR